MFKPNGVIIYVKKVNVSTEFYTKILKRTPVETYPSFTVFLLNDNFVLGLQETDEIIPKAPNHYGGFELSFSDVAINEVNKIYSVGRESVLKLNSNLKCLILDRLLWVMTPINFVFEFVQLIRQNLNKKLKQWVILVCNHCFITNS